MNLLLHQCCAPCSIYPVRKLLADGVQVHGFFYNPNIHPYTEYKKRRDALAAYNENAQIPYTVEDVYGLRDFLRMAQEEGFRCGGCYRIRLSRAAEYAVANKFQAFSSTLLYSRRQKHDLIMGIGREMAAEKGVEFFYEDYRKGWQVGIDISKQQGIYRQNYCGCIFSEEERFLPAAGCCKIPK